MTDTTPAGPTARQRYEEGFRAMLGTLAVEPEPFATAKEVWERDAQAIADAESGAGPELTPARRGALHAATLVAEATNRAVTDLSTIEVRLGDGDVEYATVLSSLTGYTVDVKLVDGRELHLGDVCWGRNDDGYETLEGWLLNEDYERYVTDGVGTGDTQLQVDTILRIEVP